MYNYTFLTKKISWLILILNIYINQLILIFSKGHKSNNTKRYKPNSLYCLAWVGIDYTVHHAKLALMMCSQTSVHAVDQLGL
jgi:hypothetical protein